MSNITFKTVFYLSLGGGGREVELAPSLGREGTGVNIVSIELTSVVSEVERTAKNCHSENRFQTTKLCFINFMTAFTHVV